jgi:hypothetical protein
MIDILQGMMKAFIRRRYKILISYFNSELNGDYMENKMVRNLPLASLGRKHESMFLILCGFPLLRE